MAIDALNQATFGVYEFFANIIPGFLVILTFIYSLGYSSVILSNTMVADSILVILLVFSAFVLGLAIQGISAAIEKPVNQKKYGGYPSSHYLDEGDSTFPKYFKERIRDLTKRKFGIPLDASSQQIFDLCYTYVMQKNISSRVKDFLRTYTFSRNMVVAMIIEAGLLFYSAFEQLRPYYALAGFAAIGLSYVFSTRADRYGKSFAEEVFRSFLVEEAPNFAKTE